MEYKRTIEIGSRVITPEDVMLFASYLNEKQKQNGGQCDFHAIFGDSTEIAADQIEMLSSPYFTRKELKELNMRYRSEDFSNSISIYFEESFDSPVVGNRINIESKDELWFDATCNRLSDLLSGVHKRHWLRNVFSIPWVVYGYFGYQVLIILFMIWPLGFRLETKGESTTTFIPLWLFFLVCIVIYAIVASLSYFLYPTVEFTFDSPRRKRRLKMRKALGWLFSTIFIPIILGILMA